VRRLAVQLAVQLAAQVVGPLLLLLLLLLLVVVVVVVVVVVLLLLLLLLSLPLLLPPPLQHLRLAAPHAYRLQPPSRGRAQPAPSVSVRRSAVTTQKHGEGEEEGQEHGKSKGDKGTRSGESEEDERFARRDDASK
jgi:hypothetical protein